MIFHNSGARSARSRGSRVAALIALVLAFSAGCTSAMEPTNPQAGSVMPTPPSSPPSTNTPADPPNTNKIIDFRQPLQDFDDFKVWANTSKELPLIASTLGLPKAYDGKPESAETPMHYEVIAPVGKYCFVAMKQDPPGSTMYSLVIMSRYNTMFSQIIPDPLELTDLKNEIDWWKTSACATGKYQPMQGEEVPSDTPTDFSVSA